MEKQQGKAPQIRFPEFKELWEHKKLSELLSEAKKRNEDLKYSKDEVLSVSGELGIVNQIEHLGRSYAGVSVHQYHVVETGDIVYTKSPLKANPFGIIKLNKGKAGIVSTLYAVYKVNQKTAYGPFIDYYFSLDANTNRYLRPLVKKGAKNDMKINNAYVLHDRIFAPNLEEQKRIASFFDVIDKKIIELRQKKELLEQYKNGVIQKIFSQELRFKDEKGKDFPKWKYFFGGEVFNSVSDKDHNSDLPILAISQEHGAIPRDLINYQISVTEKSVESYKVVKRGDYIISLRSFQGGIEYSDYHGICSPAYIILRANQTINYDFFKFYFKTHKYIQQLCSKLEGIRDGKMISYRYFSEIKIPFPSLEEQKKVAAFLLAIDKRLSVAKQEYEIIQNYKNGLIQKMYCL
jgi:type I restriction enzyme, S subunit